MKLHIASVLVATSVLSACSAADPLPVTASDPAPIVNGTVFTGNPEVVLLQMGGFLCTGTLVAMDTILTARHCVVDVTQGEVEVFFEMPGGDVRVASASHAFHPDADIAIVKLAAPAPDGLTPYPINRVDLGDQLGHEVRIVGYGDTNTMEGNAGVKRQGFTALDEIGESGEYGLIMWVGKTGSNTCQGDSGGPHFMIFDGVEYVAGVTSFGFDPCGGNPGAAVRTDSYLDWLGQFFDPRYDKVDPTVSIDSPSANAQVQPRFVVKATAADDKKVVKVELWVDDQFQSDDFTAPYELNAASNLPAGPHKIEVRAFDVSANLAKAALDVTLVPECVGDEDCGPDQACAMGSCSGAIGSSCDDNSDCASGQCFVPDPDSDFFCTITCASDSECPSGFSCNEQEISPVKKCFPGGGSSGCAVSTGRAAGGAAGLGWLAALALAALVVVRRRR